MVEVSVIVVNWNGAALLDDCLGSLRVQTLPRFEVVFVDNGSVDGSVEKARTLVPGLTVIELPENVGFARGNNVGIRASRGEFVVLLNNDTWVHPDFLSELLVALKRDPEIGMAAPKILDFFDSSVIDSVGGLVLTADGIGHGRGRGEKDIGQYDALERVLCPSGCAAMYRRKLLDEVGLFAEEFFAYCEDADLGLRAAWAGWQAVSVPAAIVRHKYSASSATYSPLKLRLVERNHYFLALRTFPPRMLLALPLWTAARFVVMAYALMAKRGKGAAASGRQYALFESFVRGHFEAIAGAVTHLRQRVQNRRISAGQFTHLLRQHRLGVRRVFLER